LLRPVLQGPQISRWQWVAGALAAVVALLATPAWTHARAAGLMTRFAYDQKTGVGAVGLHEVVVEPASFDVGGVAVPARVFTPKGVEHPPGIVLLHGVHHLGIEEPRLQKFARALASAGITVFTPQVAELADYRVDPRSLETIGAAVEAFAKRTQAKVGLMGLSFAGGLALVAASDGRWLSSLSFVVAVGAHDDLERVSRFFATDELELPDGSKKTFAAHEYGLLVLARNHVADLFDEPDRYRASEALRLWLWDEHEKAPQEALEVSAAGRDTLGLLFTHQLRPLRPKLLELIAKDRWAMAQVSPSAHLHALKVPALLLHGAGDNVIPASETLWLEHDVPKGMLAAALVSPALQHVELEGQPGWVDQWALVHFVAQLLAEAR
jgi:pimeloyl-ACP methyl ester carboxylesterase